MFLYIYHQPSCKYENNYQEYQKNYFIIHQDRLVDLIFEKYQHYKTDRDSCKFTQLIISTLKYLLSLK